MLNAETKRHIDAARDVLVGVAPNPMTQIDQITYALIYKFMDDMDQAAIKAGGEPSFFTGELEPYAWSKLVDTRMGNQEKMNLYGEALQKFAEAKQLPELFRTIFRAAFLPYRSPETLGLFLKEVNFFDYTHPEELGNAYEYLLSIMSAQGDAGQFRTPRHIIDFIVDVINPTKDDTVLDPACGTGGFLVASYNHILEQHDGKNDLSKQERPLTPDERKKLMNNFEGYDIDPSMVRIAQVNMYLHQFKNPKIVQYDSLTSEERWSDKFDVILANPPFMSPKGGIKPHNKFALQSNRSEVLFVDYIANHLKPNGRAGIIVPEGIIFDSKKAYKQLRKELVEGGLYAVVSLPSGVFNPYSGVKTSILFINNEIAKQRDEILFVKISADGYDLGATKRPIDQNDLPLALELLESFASNTFKESSIASLIAKSRIAATEDFNLSGERYSETTANLLSNWPLVELREVAIVSAGNSAPQGDEHFRDGIFPFFRTSDVGSVHLSNNLANTRDRLTQAATAGMKLFPAKTILFPKSGASTFLNHRVLTGVDGYVSSHLATIQANVDRLLPEFAYYLLMHVDARSLTADQSYPSLRLGDIEKIQIPLPPLEVQERLVAELDGYAAIIEGAKKIVENWKPRIDVSPSWPLVNLGDICELLNGRAYSQEELLSEGKYRVLRVGNFFSNSSWYFSDLELDSNKYCEDGDLLYAWSASFGAKIWHGEKVIYHYHIWKVVNDPQKVDRKFLKYLLDQLTNNFKASLGRGGTMMHLTKSGMEQMKVPLPTLDDQEEIVRVLDAEASIVESSVLLSKEFESRISRVIGNLWKE
jgi:type I restriction enzyme M protein